MKVIVAILYAGNVVDSYQANLIFQKEGPPVIQIDLKPKVIFPTPPLPKRGTIH